MQLYCRSDSRGLRQILCALQTSEPQILCGWSLYGVVTLLHHYIWQALQLSKFGLQCWEVYSKRRVCPSDDTSLSSLLLPKLWDKYRQTDRQTLMLKVILSSSLLKAVYCVPSVTVSRHYTVQSAGYRLRHLGNEISCWLSVFWDVTQCGVVEIQVSSEQNVWFFCTEDGSSEF
jgi:hypothetical protein